MTREEKDTLVKELTEKINDSSVFYLADIANLDAESSSQLRRLCHKKDIKLRVVKNTLLKRAFDSAEGDYTELYDTLKGNTSVMFAEIGNAPAKVIKEFRKKHKKPLMKGAYIDEGIYLGDEQVEFLSALKSKEEVIADIIMLLQSPAKNVVSSLQSGGNTLSGLVKALEEKAS